MPVSLFVVRWSFAETCSGLIRLGRRQHHCKGVSGIDVGTANAKDELLAVARSDKSRNSRRSGAAVLVLVMLEEDVRLFPGLTGHALRPLDQSCFVVVE